MADFSNIGEGVYWKGADGNIYMKASGLDGVQKWVAPLLPPDQLGLVQINDPHGGLEQHQLKRFGGSFANLSYSYLIGC